MSRLQETAKPFLIPLIKGETTSLSRRAQKIVSAWAAMTAMTSEFVDDEFVAVPQEDRDHLRITGRTPLGWRIWIGRYRWEPGTERWTHHVMCLAEDGYKGPAGDTSHPMNTQTTTICVGNNLVIHVMSSTVGPGQRLIRKWRFKPPIGAAMYQIGPAAAEFVRWPPECTLAERGVFYIANVFFEGVRAVMLQQTAHLR